MRSLAVKSRDNARTPMQWDDSSHAGFTQGVPWLPVNPNYLEINAAACLADPNSVLHHYRRLIELRHSSPAVVHGRFALLLPDHEQLYVFTRTWEDITVLVVANCSSRIAELPGDQLPDLNAAPVLVDTHPGSRGSTLQPWESRVYSVASG